MKIASYNIQYGFGLDGKYDTTRAIKAVKDADIIALQEVERFWQRSGCDDQVALISEQLPDHYYVYGANLDMEASYRNQEGRLVHRRRQFGNMILSRYPILSSRNFPLPKRATLTQHSIQQGLLEAVIETPLGPLRFYSTHLSHLCAETRLPQIDECLEIINRAPSDGGAWCGGHPNPAAGWTEGDMPPMPQPCIWMGDMNFTHLSQEYTRILGPLSPNHGRLYHPHGLLDSWIVSGHSEGEGTSSPNGGRIDHCFISASLQKHVSSCTIDTEATGSDHFPVHLTLKP